MQLNYRVTVPIVTEPLTLKEAKDHLRLTSGEFTDDTAEDSLILSQIATAREYCEAFTGRALATQTIEAYADGFWSACFELPRPPLQSVTSVKYTDYAGIETTLDVNTHYLVDANSLYGRIALPYAKWWPVFVAYPINPIKITYVAGYTDTNKIPESIKNAMKLLIGHWYKNRETMGDAGGDIGFATKALLSIYKAKWNF